MAVDLRIEGDRPLPGNATTALHRIAQECLNSAAKYAEATQVFVELVCDPEDVVLRFTDNDRGLDPAHIPSGHFGIEIMRDRAQQIGAIYEMVVDDHPIVRDGLKTILLTADDMVLIGVAGDGREALARCQESVPDVILMDVLMPACAAPTKVTEFAQMPSAWSGITQ